MLISETKIRVRYGETDQMGYVYYGNYASYYEVARADMMRQLGTSYKEMEEMGCMMPMVDMNVRFLKPAKYDDVLRIKTIVSKMPASRMTFLYEVYNDENGQLINTAETTLAFINAKTFRATRAPHWFLNIIEKYWDKFNQ